MRTASLASCGLALLVGAWSACAGSETKHTKPAVEDAKKAKVQPQAQSSTLTGSYLKRTVRRSGTITDGPSQVIVLDRGTIENSGAADLRELLTRKGLHR